jgi:hypothetical protein
LQSLWPSHKAREETWPRIQAIEIVRREYDIVKPLS